jgi:hypothetical protein
VVDVGDVTTYTIPGLTAGGWYFVASAYNDYGESDYSNEVTIGYLPDSPVIRVVVNVTVEITKNKGE